MFKTGDNVKWTSQAQGHTKTKAGVVANRRTLMVLLMIAAPAYVASSSAA